MRRAQLKPKSHPEIDHRKAILSLRWLLVVLASYLALFTYLGSPILAADIVILVAFAVSNVVFMLISNRQFPEERVQRAIAVLDVGFITAILYLLRVPENYLYIAFTAIIVLAVIWRDLRLVVFSLLAVSVLFGVFTYFRLFGFDRDVNVEQFLTLSLFFVVSVFYVFLSERLAQDGKMSSNMLEEARLSELMVEMTRALSSSLNSDDVLYSIVSRLRQVLDAEECSIFRIDARTGTVRMMKASRPEERNIQDNLYDYP
jgi:K+-sensing histidine kinase KdpD